MDGEVRHVCMPSCHALGSSEMGLEVPVMVAASGVSAADLFLLSPAAKPDIGSYAQMVGHVEKSLTLLVQHKFATLQTL